jgi:hypothetical protein
LKNYGESSWFWHIHHDTKLVCHIMHVLAYILFSSLYPDLKYWHTLCDIVYVYFYCPLLFNFYNLNDFKYTNKKNNVFDIKNFGVNIFILISFYILSHFNPTHFFLIHFVYTIIKGRVSHSIGACSIYLYINTLAWKRGNFFILIGIEVKWPALLN